LAEAPLTPKNFRKFSCRPVSSRNTCYASRCRPLCGLSAAKRRQPLRRSGGNIARGERFSRTPGQRIQNIMPPTGREESPQMADLERKSQIPRSLKGRSRLYSLRPGARKKRSPLAMLQPLLQSGLARCKFPNAPNPGRPLRGLPPVKSSKRNSL